MPSPNAPSPRLTLRLAAALRRLVVLTDVPPLRWLYLGYYHLVARLVGWGLSRHPNVVTVYLRRGCAKGELRAGISDIDLAVVLRDEQPERTGRWWRQPLNLPFDWYVRMVQLTGVLDARYDTYPVTRLEEGWTGRYWWRYRLTEGRETWRRLAGEDIFDRVPRLTRDELTGPLHADALWWWHLFTQRYLQARAGATERKAWTHSSLDFDSITRASVCYKVVAEIVKGVHAFRSGELPWRRAEALRLARPALVSPMSELVDRLVALERRRFLPDAGAIAAETFAALVPYLAMFYTELAAHPFTQPLHQTPVRIDAPPAELPTLAAARTHACRLVDHAARRWGSALRGAYVVPLLAAEIDELALLLEIDPSQPPTLEQLVALNALDATATAAAASPLHCYLLLPEAALYVGRETFTGSWQPILLRAAAPAAFALASEAAFVLHGPPLPTQPPRWTLPLHDFTWSRKLRGFQFAFARAAEAWPPPEFREVFWKCLQLVVLERSARRGEPVAAMTPPAIMRGLAAEGIAFPETLASLADFAQPPDPATIAAAIAFLRAVEPEGDRFRGAPPLSVTGR